MAKVEKGGIRLVVENYEAFERQMTAASASMRGFGQEAQATARMVSASAGEYSGSTVTIEKWNETIDTSAEESQKAAQAYTKMGLALVGLGAAGATFLGGVGLQASRIEELAVLLEVTRKNAIFLAEAEGDLEKAASFTSEAVDEQVRGVRALNLSGEVANRAVAELIRYNLDWTKATELARLAQDAATFAMQDSSEAVKGLIAGITTLQPRLLRTYGLMINLNVAYRKYAEANDIAVKDMSVMQRQQAAFQEVLALAPSIAGAYEAAMGTAAKQVRSLRTDVVNLAEAFGEEYTPALNEGVSALRSLLRGLIDLPDPMQAFIVGASGSGVALAGMAGSALLLLAKLPTLAAGFTTLAGAIGLSTVALSGLLLGIPLIVGGIVALNEVQKAHQEEAAAILDSSDTYAEYIAYINSAGVETNMLSEALYGMAKAAQEADESFSAIDFQQAADELRAMQAENLTFIKSIPTFTAETTSASDAVDLMTQRIDDMLPSLSDLQVQMLQNRDIVVQQGIALGLTDEGLVTYTGHVLEAAAAEEYWRLARAPIGDHEERMKGVVKVIEEEGEALHWTMGRRAKYIEHLVNERLERQRLAEVEKAFSEEAAEAFLKATDKIEDAATKRNRALEDLDTKYLNKSADAWRDYQDALIKSEGKLEQFHAGTLDELLDLDLDYLQDRNDAWDQYQQDLADAERELQRDIEDANRDRVQALSDLDREYSQDRADALRELNEDIEDAARDHQEALVDIEKERQESALDLEEDYQQRLYDIQNLGQQKLLELQLDYQERASDVRLKYLREALESIEGGFYAEQFKQELRDLFLGLREFGPGEIPYTFQQMYDQMLKDLEGLRDDQKWAEEDLSDDIDREQDQRLTDLQEWLLEEKTALDEAHEERLASEQERYADEQAARQEDYDRKLEDLRIAHGREKEEIDIDHQRRLTDIGIQAERERAAIAETYARRLEDLNIEHDRERELIGQKLEEQNQTARDKYDEALADINTAKERERDAINTQYARTKEDIQADYEDTVRIAAEEFGKLPAAFQPVYDDLTTQAQAEMRAVRDAIMAEINGLFGDLQARSPSRVMMKLADSIMTGLEAGGLNPDAASDLIGDAFSAQAFQANISAALPEQVAAMPMGMMGGSSSTTNNNLSVTAQYQHQSEASLRDDLSLYNSMLRAWGR